VNSSTAVMGYWQKLGADVKDEGAWVWNGGVSWTDTVSSKVRVFRWEVLLQTMNI